MQQFRHTKCWNVTRCHIYHSFHIIIKIHKSTMIVVVLNVIIVYYFQFRMNYKGFCEYKEKLQTQTFMNSVLIKKSSFLQYLVLFIVYLFKLILLLLISLFCSLISRLTLIICKIVFTFPLSSHALYIVILQSLYFFLTLTTLVLLTLL